MNTGKNQDYVSGFSERIGFVAHYDDQDRIEIALKDGTVFLEINDNCIHIVSGKFLKVGFPGTNFCNISIKDYN